MRNDSCKWFLALKPPQHGLRNCESLTSPDEKQPPGPNQHEMLEYIWSYEYDEKGANMISSQWTGKLATLRGSLDCPQVIFFYCKTILFSEEMRLVQEIASSSLISSTDKHVHNKMRGGKPRKY